jgi:ABC-2 type transport system ATP-binding protein
MSEFMIEVHHFRKDYGDFTAVADLSFSVRKGEIYGLLGPNGAGKTSTLECLEGLRQPSGGRLLVSGVDPSTDSRR